MKCPNCQTDLEVIKWAWMAGPPEPDYGCRCARCRADWAVFCVGGEAVWVDLRQMPRGCSTSEYVNMVISSQFFN